MTRGAPKKIAAEPLLWRVEGKSGDGKLVTLGKYRTREQAEAEIEKWREARYYRELRIMAIPPPVPPPAPPA